MTFSVIIPTKGRETLARTLQSVCGQLQHGDEILVLRLDCLWGNEARDRLIEKASGTHLLFIDDDDVFLDGALQCVRDNIVGDEDKVHIFRMRYANGTVLWGAEMIVPSNVGTPMFCIPNDVLGKWADDDSPTSDFNFIESTMRQRGDEPVWHLDVIAEVRPD